MWLQSFGADLDFFDLDCDLVDFRPTLVGVNKKVERREKVRAARAEKAAKIEDAIKAELVERLRQVWVFCFSFFKSFFANMTFSSLARIWMCGTQGTYEGIANIPAKAYQEVLSEEEVTESEQEDDEEAPPEELEEDEDELEFVEGYEEDDDDMEDSTFQECSLSYFNCFTYYSSFSLAHLVFVLSFFFHSGRVRVRRGTRDQLISGSVLSCLGQAQAARRQERVRRL